MGGRRAENPVDDPYWMNPRRSNWVEDWSMPCNVSETIKVLLVPSVIEASLQVVAPGTIGEAAQVDGAAFTQEKGAPRNATVTVPIVAWLWK